MKKITDSQYFIILYLYYFTFQALLKSVVPVLFHSQLGVFQRLHIFVLEVKFFLKSLLIKFFRIQLTRESFFGYTMEFPNYLEFTLLFIEIFGIQEYRLSVQKKHMVIIDCGSSWGMSVLYFKHMCPDASIVAIEANRNTAKLLQQNIKRNGLHDIKTRVAFVTGSPEKIHPFYTFQSNDGWSVSDTGASDFVKGRTDMSVSQVESVHLSHLIRENKADLVKLDIEGMEGEVLHESKNYLKLVDEYVLEYHPGMNKGKNSLDKILKLFELNKFTVNVINTKSIIEKDNSLKMIYAVSG